ncbi:MAG: serine hydrolase [Dehalococcoidia bacterium]|nr:serine hydrolase [Dehalococcoidia bacterium]
MPIPARRSIAIAVTDLQTGHTIHVNGDRPRLSGCVMNLYVRIDAIREVQYGQLSRGDIEGLVYATTWSSNAVTAFQLYSMMGGGNPIEGASRAADIHRQLGLGDGMVIDHPPGFPGYSRGVNANNYITAVDINETLSQIYHREVLDETHTQFLLGAMGQVKPGLNYLTAAGVPSRATVHHKNGFFPYSGGYVDNDAGIVRFQGGGQEYAYAVTFLSQRVPEKYSQLPLAQEMMRRTWSYFDNRY